MYKPTPAELGYVGFKEEDKGIWKLPVGEDTVVGSTNIMYYEGVGFSIEIDYLIGASIYPKSYLDLIQFINIFKL